MGEILGAALLVAFWLGSKRIGEMWARSVGAPYWFAVVVAQCVGAASVMVGLVVLVGPAQFSLEHLLLGAFVGLLHSAVIGHLMQKQSADW